MRNAKLWWHSLRAGARVQRQCLEQFADEVGRDPQDIAHLLAQHEDDEEREAAIARHCDNAPRCKEVGRESL